MKGTKFTSQPETAEIMNNSGKKLKHFQHTCSNIKMTVHKTVEQCKD